MYTSEHPPFAVAVDIVVFTIAGDELRVLLIRRGVIPFRDKWALPGGLVLIDEDLEDAAYRELAEETGIEPDDVGHLEQFGAYGRPDRDPRSPRTVSVAYWAIVPDLHEPRGGSDAAYAELVPVALAEQRPPRPRSFCSCSRGIGCCFFDGWVCRIVAVERAVHFEAS